VVGLVRSVTSLVDRVSGVSTVPFLVPVSMVHIVTLPMASAHVRLLMDVSVLRDGLDLTAVCPVTIALGGQTVIKLVCVSTIEELAIT